MRMIWTGGQGYVYIGRWDEREPLDQTDLNNGWDAIFKAIEDRRYKPADRWGTLGRPTWLLGWPTWLYARWVPPWRVWFLESSRIFSIWFCVEICFLHRRPPFLASLSGLIPEKHRYTKTRGILSVNPLFYLYISYLYINSYLVDGLKWHLTTVNNIPEAMLSNWKSSSSTRKLSSSTRNTSSSTRKLFRLQAWSCK
jgi:hypothetical protein